ncbi:hypothetical protein EYF80_062046 [Liparis tanakae]|uniref:Uncharacterized protein n=1 Tax=Liparis tanakae TaxID=230148 RepID=A0A4Z2EFT4_9TELE|nr:hypothetical protein EYF80_062046 [Liparis tanakae]
MNLRITFPPTQSLNLTASPPPLSGCRRFPDQSCFLHTPPPVLGGASVRLTDQITAGNHLYS